MDASGTIAADPAGAALPGAADVPPDPAAVLGAVAAAGLLAVTGDDPPAVQPERPNATSTAASEVVASVDLRRTHMGSILPHHVDRGGFIGSSAPESAVVCPRGQLPDSAVAQIGGYPADNNRIGVTASCQSRTQTQQNPSRDGFGGSLTVMTTCHQSDTRRR